jgi:hypothetical protein
MGDIVLDVYAKDNIANECACILSMFADVKALTSGFSRQACSGRTT